MTNTHLYLEVLKMAKDLVINDHMDRRAELHNRWLLESEQVWKSQKLRVAYPTIPPYPTDNDILEIAKRLLAFIPHSDTSPPGTSIEEVQRIMATTSPQRRNALIMLPKDGEQTVDPSV